MDGWIASALLTKSTFQIPVTHPLNSPREVRGDEINKNRIERDFRGGGPWGRREAFLPPLHLPSLSTPSPLPSKIKHNTHSFQHPACSTQCFSAAWANSQLQIEPESTENSSSSLLPRISKCWQRCPAPTSQAPSRELR